MIQSLWDVFRFDRMVVWYLSDAEAFLFPIILIAAVLAVRFHIRQKATPAAKVTVNVKQERRFTQRVIVRVLWTVEAIAIAWIYWINSESLTLGGGQRAGLYVVSFLLMYTLILSLHGERSSSDTNE